MPEPMAGGLKPMSLPCCLFKLPVMAVGCGIRNRVTLFRLGMLRLISSWVVGSGAATAQKKSVIKKRAPGSKNRQYLDPQRVQ